MLDRNVGHLGRFLAFLAIGLLLSLPALALPPPGVESHSPAERAWWQCMSGSTPVGRIPMICCEVADGHVLDDGDVRTSQDAQGDTVYSIRVEGRWYDVPPGALVSTKQCGNEPDPVKRASTKVWLNFKCENGNYGPDDVVCGEPPKIANILIYCFLPGVLY